MARTKGAKDKKPRQIMAYGQPRGIAKEQNPELEPGYNTMKVGNLAAYAAIGIDKHLVFEWENRQGETEANRDRLNFVKKVKKICAMYREGLMEDGKINPVTGIFWQKNYDGFKDQQEVVVTPKNPLGELPSEEELAKQITDALPVDDYETE